MSSMWKNTKRRRKSGKVIAESRELTEFVRNIRFIVWISQKP